MKHTFLFVLAMVLFVLPVIATDVRQQDGVSSFVNAAGGVSDSRALAERPAEAGTVEPKSGSDAATEDEELTEIKKPDVIFVPTPQELVEKMLELAKVSKDDVVYDLGCGDGRIVVTAAKKYGCKGFGYDIDPERVKESWENVKKNNVQDLVKIEQKDIFTLDLSQADVVTLYLLPSLNVKLIPQLEKLKPGSRIVSHDFDMKGVIPDQVVKVEHKRENSEEVDESTIYLWTVPLKKEASDTNDKQSTKRNKG